MGYNSIFNFVLRKVKKELKGKILIQDKVFNKQTNYSVDLIVFPDIERIFTQNQKKIFIPMRIFIPLALVPTVKIFSKEKYRAIEQSVEYLNVVCETVWTYSGESYITIEVPEKERTKEQVWEKIKNDLVIFSKKIEKEFQNKKAYFLSEVIEK